LYKTHLAADGEDVGRAKAGGLWDGSLPGGQGGRSLGSTGRHSPRIWKLPRNFTKKVCYIVLNLLTKDKSLVFWDVCLTHDCVVPSTLAPSDPYKLALVRMFICPPINGQCTSHRIAVV